MFNNKFSKFFFWFFILIIFLVMVSFAFNTTISPYLSRESNQIVAKVDYFLSRPFTFVRENIQNSKKLLKINEENRKLKSMLKALSEDTNELNIYKDENKKLKELLGVNFPYPKKHISQLIVRTPRSWSDSIIVSFSKSTSINHRTLALSGSALIGKVSKNTASTANIDLLTSGKVFDLPIKVEDSKKTIYGSLKSFDKKTQLMEASEFNSADPVSLGAKVFTSGLDGETASDIPVGIVSQVKDSNDKLKRQVFIQLSGQFDEIKYVSLVGKE